MESLRLPGFFHLWVGFNDNPPLLLLVAPKHVWGYTHPPQVTRLHPAVHILSQFVSTREKAAIIYKREYFPLWVGRKREEKRVGKGGEELWMAAESSLQGDETRCGGQGAGGKADR